MAGVFHISEQEAARDFRALIRRVRAGEEVVVQGGGKPVVVTKSTGPCDHAAVPALRHRQGKTVGKILEGLNAWEAGHGVVALDKDFAANVAEAHERLNQPLDSTRWN